MKSISNTHAQWHAHVNGVAPSRHMRDWLVDTMSLTAKLKAHSGHFRVQRLRQRNALCLVDETAAIGLPRRRQVQEREVLLRCDGSAVVYAHTVMPLSATSADWPFFRSLGERSLGTTLFGDPRVWRGRLEFARLRPGHPLLRRAELALGLSFTQPLYARRCLYRRGRGQLLVTELFLPAIAALHAARGSRPDLLNAA